MNYHITHSSKLLAICFISNYINDLIYGINLVEMNCRTYSKLFIQNGYDYTT